LFEANKPLFVALFTFMVARKALFVVLLTVLSALPAVFAPKKAFSRSIPSNPHGELEYLELMEVAGGRDEEIKRKFF
jgi:hypothetical protein